MVIYLEFAELLGMDAKPYTFSYAELRNATGEFSPSNKLGEGGFGPVYKVGHYLIEIIFFNDNDYDYKHVLSQFSNNFVLIREHCLMEELWL